jgi:hypothetical protein
MPSKNQKEGDGGDALRGEESSEAMVDFEGAAVHAAVCRNRRIVELPHCPGETRLLAGRDVREAWRASSTA